MIISEDTQSVVDYLDQYTENNLRKKNDVAVILELAVLVDNAEHITHLSFQSTVMWKVFGLMRKSTPGTEGYQQLESEFAAAMNEIRAVLHVLSDASDEEVVKRFSDTYLGMSAGVIRNLTDLAHDFARFKEMQNELRRAQES